MLKYLQMAQVFDAAAMQQEVAQLEAQLWQQHYNRQHYAGEWTVLSLRSIQGRADTVVAVHAGASAANVYEDAALLQRCPYLQSVLRFFACEKTAVRLMKLHAGAEIKEHRDHALCFEDGEVRFHVPVVTSPDVFFYLEEERLVMQEGECWYLNLSLPHRVINRGTSDRVHLVIDCQVNAWVAALFAQQARCRKEMPAEQGPHYDRATREKIIAELRRLQTPEALAIAAQMETELPLL